MIGKKKKKILFFNAQAIPVCFKDPPAVTDCKVVAAHHEVKLLPVRAIDHMYEWCVVQLMHATRHAAE